MSICYVSRDLGVVKRECSFREYWKLANSREIFVFLYVFAVEVKENRFGSNAIQWS